MATSEEILDSRIIGFIEPKGPNAQVTVLGYKNEQGDYCVLDRSKAKAIFCPDGKVWAGKFQFDREVNPITPYSFIEFSVTQSPKSADFYGDDYIVDYDFNKKYSQKTFTSILSINSQTSLESGFITQDEIFSCINKNELKNINGNFFLKYKNNLYGLFKYEENTESVRPAVGKEANVYEIDLAVYQEKCFTFNQQEYYLGNMKDFPFKQIGLIDCMDDKQLGEWFKKQLKVCVETEQILSLKKDTFQEFASVFKETNDAIEDSRLERIRGKVDSLSFTFREIKDLLATDSFLTKNLKNTLQNMKDEFREEWSKSLQSERGKLEKEISELENKKNAISKSVSKAESEYKKKSEELEKSFTEKKIAFENSITETNRKYTVIKENYDLLIESIKLQALPSRKTDFEPNSIEPIAFKAEGEKFSVLEENEGYGFFSLLKENLELEDLAENLKNQLNKENELFTHKACFIPSVSWAYLYAKAVRNSKLYTIHVEHDWLHYKDFLNNGLLEILKSCDENTEMNHILVFDSLNLTQPECGLKPLLDVIAGYSIILPVYNKPLPDNLKIFATIVPFTGENKIGLPLDIQSFANWGQIYTPEDKLTLRNNFLDCKSSKGYFEPKNLLTKSAEKGEKVNNGYFAE